MAATNTATRGATQSTGEFDAAHPLDGGVVVGAGEAVRSLSLAAPLHPILVHYTIALTSASLLFDFLGRVLHVPGLAVTGWWTLALSAAATVLTLATGAASRARLDIGEGAARSYLRLHMALGPAFFGLLVAMTIWRALLWRAEREAGWAYLAAMTLTAAVMAVQGYAGGELVYRWGADVEGRHRDLRQRQAGQAPPHVPGTIAPKHELHSGEGA
ncbi:MAG: DUF2231 domain-containing protein [Gemmatimonadaceae bacterium]